MKGKVFASSQNLYQDQAKVLFDYYRQAAEEIVLREEAIEGKIKEQEEEKVKTEAAVKSSKMTMIVMLAIGVALGGGGLIVGERFAGILVIAAIVLIVFGVIKLSRMTKSKKTMELIVEELETLHEQYENIFRDYKVEKLGIVYVPVASQIPFENKSFFVDHTGSMSRQEFELQIVNDQKNLIDRLKELDALSTSAPFVEDSKEAETVNTDNYSRSIQQVTYYDYFSKMDRTLRVSAQCLADLSISSVSLPIVPPESRYASYLNDFATNDVGGYPVLNVFDTHRFDKEIDDFNSLNEMRHSLAQQSEQFEDVLRRLIRNVGTAIQTISMLKVASSNKLVDQSNNLLFNILKVSYNHYSPDLEHEEIEKMRTEFFNFSESVESYTPFNLKQSSRVRYDMISGTWVAEDGSRTVTPFGISQIQEEIVAPIVQSLLMETRVERLRIYNDIKNQKINYLNQWHQDTEDFYGRNRSSSDDLRNLMRSNLTKFMAAQNTLSSLQQMKSNMRGKSLEVAKDSGEEALLAFQMQTQQLEAVQNDFEAYMGRLQEDIDMRAKEFGYIEYFDGTLRDKNAKDIVEAIDHVDELDERRKPLAIVNPLYAKNSLIPPKPSIENIVDEHISMNLSTMANVTLQELDEQEVELYHKDPSVVFAPEVSLYEEKEVQEQAVEEEFADDDEDIEEV